MDDEDEEVPFGPRLFYDDGRPQRFRREDEIDQIRTALRRLLAWFRQKAFHAANAGDISANTIFLELLRRIISYSAPKPDVGQDFIAAEVARLLELEKRSEAYVTFGLTPRFPVKEIISIVQNSPASQRQTISIVLSPLVESFEARLEALKDVQELMSLFVTTMQEFYRTKGVLYSIPHGLQIWAPGGGLIRPEWLSSGERQLLLLFSNTIIARDRPSLFIIDEPELSLNIKWQRQLLNALCAFASGRQIQFLLATHSFEVLAQHTESVAPLVAPSATGPHTVESPRDGSR